MVLLVFVVGCPGGADDGCVAAAWVWGSCCGGRGCMVPCAVLLVC